MNPTSQLICDTAPQADFVDRLVATASAAAHNAGRIQIQAFRNTKDGCTRLLHDIKVETDRRCETVIVETLRNVYPDHAILTEESGLLPGCGEYTWIVDPLDGTVNFWHGIPFFCVSIACYHNGVQGTVAGVCEGLPIGRPVAGVVFLPMAAEMFVGMAGRGAFLNGRPIGVCRAAHASDMVVSVSFGKTPEAMQRMTCRLEGLLPQVRKARCLGAAAAELAYAAAGFLGGVIYEGLKPWDFAAGRILLEEAGGFMEAVEILPGQYRVWAGGPAVRPSLEALMSIG
jgi:fructose-1,6-bisphosphatase/inositol monophosphatase family enzyme